MGRWVVQDPVIHHDYSPYSAFDNNPVYWSDPSGADSQLYKDKNGNVVAGSFDGQDAQNLFNQYLNSSSKKSEEEVQKMYEFTTSEENDGNGGGGDGNGKQNTSNTDKVKKQNEKNEKIITFIKSTDLAFSINKYSRVSKYVTAGTKYLTPVAEIGAYTYKYVNANELSQSGIYYTKGEYIYDTSGVLVGFVVGAEVGAQLGGAYGAVAGIIIGGGFELTKQAYNTAKPSISQSFNNFINTTINNWMKYK